MTDPTHPITPANVPEPKKEDTVNESSKDGVELPELNMDAVEGDFVEEIIPSRHRELAELVLPLTHHFAVVGSVTWAANHLFDILGELGERERQLLAAFARAASLEAERDSLLEDRRMATENLAQALDERDSIAEDAYHLNAEKNAAESALAEIRGKIAGLGELPKYDMARYGIERKDNGRYVQFSALESILSTVKEE